VQKLRCSLVTATLYVHTACFTDGSPITFVHTSGWMALLGTLLLIGLKEWELRLHRRETVVRAILDDPSEYSAVRSSALLKRIGFGDRLPSKVAGRLNQQTYMEEVSCPHRMDSEPAMVWS
jgi:hypothetical protein